MSCADFYFPDGFIPVQMAISSITDADINIICVIRYTNNQTYMRRHWVITHILTLIFNAATQQFAHTVFLISHIHIIWDSISIWLVIIIDVIIITLFIVLVTILTIALITILISVVRQ